MGTLACRLVKRARDDAKKAADVPRLLENIRVDQGGAQDAETEARAGAEEEKLGGTLDELGATPGGQRRLRARLQQVPAGTGRAELGKESSLAAQLRKASSKPANADNIQALKKKLKAGGRFVGGRREATTPLPAMGTISP